MIKVSFQIFRQILSMHFLVLGIVVVFFIYFIFTRASSSALLGEKITLVKKTSFERLKEEHLLWYIDLLEAADSGKARSITQESDNPGNRLAKLHESGFCIAYIPVLAAVIILLAFCSPHVTSWNLYGLHALRLPAKYLKKESSSPLSFFSLSTWGRNSLISLGDDRKLEEIQSWFFSLKGLFPFISFISIQLKVMRLCRSDFKEHNFEMMVFA